MKPSMKGGLGAATMIDRTRRLLTQPQDEWRSIDAEPMSSAGIYQGWVLPLAAIGPVATLIGSLVFGYSAFGVTYRPTIVGALGTAAVSYVLSLVSVFVLALIIDALAPSFGGTRNQSQALKVSAFSMTAAWLAAIFGLVPLLGMLSIVGLYSLYLLFVGLPILMRAPADKALGYTVVSILAAAVLFIMVGLVGGAVSSLFAPSMLAGSAGTLSGAVDVPGVGSVDLGKLEAATKQMEEAGRRAEQAQVTGASIAVAPDALQALLPAAIASYPRTEVSSAAAGSGGIGGSNAEGRYEGDGASIRLGVTDIAAASGIAALGSAFQVQSNRETATGYERTSTIDGRMTTEEWDRDSKSGTYSVLVASRFMVEATGTAPDIDTLKSAVGTIPIAKLEAMAK